MAFMPWTDDYLTGIRQIDEQHRWLVYVTNRLYDEISKPVLDKNMIGDILYSLLDYAMNHFMVEENLFKQHNYPESEAHRAEHNKFKQTAADLLDKHDSGEMVNKKALKFLKDWLNHHILKIDQKYVSFFKEKSVR